MRRSLTLFIALGALGLAACGGGDDPTATPAATTVASSTPAGAGAAGSGLAPSDIFARVAPSIAFIETPIGTGSAILLDEQWLVSNAHVVWPYEQVRVVFADGTEFVDAPVHAWDLMADLSVIRLPEGHGIPPVAFADPLELPMGSELYLIGYPAENEEFPQPTISSGVLSRVRDWDVAGLTYIQTDAAIAGGQSGGALVSNMGDVVGLSGFKFADAFGLALSAPIVEERTNGLIDGTDVNSFSDRRLARNSTDNSISFSLSNYYEERAFIVREPTGSLVELEITGANDVSIDIYDASGVYITSVDDGATGSEIASFEVDFDVPFIVVAKQLNLGLGEFEISSSSDLALQNDPDDGRLLSRERTYAGNIDYAADVDVFEIDLEADETVTIRVETLHFDPDMVIDAPDNLDEALAYDDDSAGGLFGTDAELTFTAPATDRYILAIADVNFVEVGSYYLIVD